MRLDKYLSEKSGITRTQAAKLIESGACTVNGVEVRAKKHLVSEQDTVALAIPDPEPTDILPENIPVDVRYEDEFVIVVNKPQGMVVHPAAGHYSGTLVNALMYHCETNGGSLSGINGEIRPGIVHRIDKDTSGLLVVAKNDVAHLSLAEQLQNRTMSREYEAVVHGRVKSGGVVNAPIGRSVCDRKKMCVTAKNSREAVTHYEAVEVYERFTHVRVRLETGRTHQIRVHMAFIGHPIAGDSVYGKPRQKLELSLNGQCLHAKKLAFDHPKSGERIEFESELPNYFVRFLKSCSHGPN
jgi:23S rRNA pseudouridine1911/1915/1917 synthase